MCTFIVILQVLPVMCVVFNKLMGSCLLCISSIIFSCLFCVNVFKFIMNCFNLLWLGISMTLCGLGCNCSCSCNVVVIICILIYSKLLVKHVKTTTVIPYVCDMVKALYFWSWYREVLE